MNAYLSGTKKLLRQPALFARYASGTRLRRYQSGVCEAICDSILHSRGLSFVVMFPRQSGKNELQAQLETYLLALFSDTPVEMVKVSPTLKPQAQNAMRRLERTLKKNLYLSRSWRKEAGALYRIGRSAHPVPLRRARKQHRGRHRLAAARSGRSAGCAARQVRQGHRPHDRLDPRHARLLGHRLDEHSLLGRELRAARDAEAQDGQKRVFRLTADDVSAEVPAYRASVQEAVARLGRTHPLVRTQYFSEEIDGLGGLFPPDRLAAHAKRPSPALPARTFTPATPLRHSAGCGRSG